MQSDPIGSGRIIDLMLFWRFTAMGLMPSYSKACKGPLLGLIKYTRELLEQSMSSVEAKVIRPELDVFSHQVQCDINFLEARLRIMREQHNPNQQVIRTYQEMLDSRIQVLQRLRDEQENVSQIG